MRLSGKTAVVTGGTRGIGRAIVLRLAREGAAVWASYRADAGCAARLEEDAAAEHGWDVRIRRCDVTDRAEVRALFDEVGEASGRVDILVNNAGITLRTRLGETEEADLDRLWAVNVKGPFFCIEAAVPHMPVGGRIINLSSTAGRAAALVDFSIYGATKGAIDSLTRRLAAELAPRGITVNAVAPGFVETDAGRAEARRAQMGDEIASRIPLGRMGTPEDIADVVAFLASDDARWITGQSVNASGGQVW